MLLTIPDVLSQVALLLTYAWQQLHAYLQCMHVCTMPVVQSVYATDNQSVDAAIDCATTLFCQTTYSMLADNKSRAHTAAETVPAVSVTEAAALPAVALLSACTRQPVPRDDTPKTPVTAAPQVKSTPATAVPSLLSKCQLWMLHAQSSRCRPGDKRDPSASYLMLCIAQVMQTRW